MADVRPGIALFGGTFDPVHHGHLILAQEAAEQLHLSCVYLLPAAQNPHKADAPVAGAQDRLELCRRAVEGSPRLDVLDWDVSQPGPSYACDTASRAAQYWPGHRRYWLIGEDQLPGLPRWKAVEQLVQHVEYVVFARGGQARMSCPAVPGLRLIRLKARRLDVSSTELRARLRDGLPVDFWTPPGVIEGIRRRGLYGG